MLYIILIVLCVITKQNSCSSQQLYVLKNVKLIFFIILFYKTMLELKPYKLKHMVYLFKKLYKQETFLRTARVTVQYFTTHKLYVLPHRWLSKKYAQ